jgi:adenine deaminase
MIDTVLTNCQIADPSNQEVYSADLKIKDGVIAEIGGVNRRGARVVDLNGGIVCPGFIDFHIHIESSMLSPIEFARAAVRHGTTTVMVDPHEIANVCGMEGVRLFLRQAELLPLDMYVGIPSCVPATNLETSGAAITLEEIGELLPDPRIYGLAEMMNFPGIIFGFGDARDRVDLVFDNGKLVDGHCPGLVGEDLVTYITNGHKDGVVRIMTDHETLTADEANEKAASGMFVGLRCGSATKDMERILPGLIANHVALDRFLLCSDDLDPMDLSLEGHMDRIIRVAREIFLNGGEGDESTAALKAMALATVNPGRYISQYLTSIGSPPIGEIKVGFKANLAIMDTLVSMNVNRVILGGSTVVEDGEVRGEAPEFEYDTVSGKMNIGRKLNSDDFRVPSPNPGENIETRVIEMIPESLETRSTTISLPNLDGAVQPLPQADVARIAVFERHHASGNATHGFVKGLGLKRGALASTVAHDSHNVIVAGIDGSMMAEAVNTLSERGGGMVVVLANEVEYFPLEIAGLMSTSPIDRVVAAHHRLIEAVQKTGTPLHNPFMALAFLALPVIPQFKITDRGLVDVQKFDFVDLF